MKIPIYSNLKHAKTTMKNAKNITDESIKRLEDQRKLTLHDLDRLGTLELEILNGFKEFVELHEKLGIIPNFAEYTKNDVDLPQIDLGDLQRIAGGANILLNSLGSAALGTAGGFATYGAISTAAIHMAFSAIKGSVIPVVHLASGATLASVGAVGTTALTSSVISAGGSVALTSGIIATGTGTALGSVALSAAGPIGLIVGSTIISISASKLSKKADKAYSEALKAKREVSRICKYLEDLTNLSNRFYESVLTINLYYKKHWQKFQSLVVNEGKNPLLNFSSEELLLTQNLYLLVQLLYSVCQISLVLEENQDGLNKLNTNEVNKALEKAKLVAAENDISSNESTDAESPFSVKLSNNRDERMAAAILYLYFCQRDKKLREDYSVDMFELTKDAESEITAISGEVFTFGTVQEYLDKVPDESLVSLYKMVSTFMENGSGKTAAKISGKDRLDVYLANRGV